MRKIVLLILATIVLSCGIAEARGSSGGGRGFSSGGFKSGGSFGGFKGSGSSGSFGGFKSAPSAPSRPSMPAAPSTGGSSKSWSFGGQKATGMDSAAASAARQQGSIPPSAKASSTGSWFGATSKTTKSAYVPYSGVRTRPVTEYRTQYIDRPYPVYGGGGGLNMWDYFLLHQLMNGNDNDRSEVRRQMEENAELKAKLEAEKARMEAAGEKPDPRLLQMDEPKPEASKTFDYTVIAFVAILLIIGLLALVAKIGPP